MGIFRRNPATEQVTKAKVNSQGATISKSGLGVKTIQTETAPPASPQFSQAIKYDGKVYVSGNIGLLPGTDGKLAQGTVKYRARQAFKNMEAVLEDFYSSIRQVLKVTVYLTKMSDLPLVDEAWDEIFTGKCKPARTCVAVAELRMGTDIEVDCEAYSNRN